MPPVRSDDEDASDAWKKISDKYTLKSDSIPKTELQEYLDEAITRWREIRDGKVKASKYHQSIAAIYIDAYQSARVSLLSEVLK